jgi:Putative DnaT-like ssDNA binding protein
MALVIENGSVVPGADSFATTAELVTYAANFGRVIPADVAAQEALLRRSALQMTSLPWKGQTVSRDQALAWPRANVKRQGWILPINEIPAQVKAGQLALATEIHADDLVDPTTKTGAVVSETVGPISTTFAVASTAVSRPAATRQSYAQFAGLLESSSQVNLVRS